MINLRSLFKIDTIDTSPQAVKKTGNAFLIVGCFLAVVFFLVQSHVNGWLEWNWHIGFENSLWKWFIGVGGTIYVGSRLAYPVMKPFHTGWMALALALGWLTSHLLLTVYFYLIITPIGLFMRGVGKDLLDEKINPSAESYWVKRERKPFNRQDYERLF